MRWGENMYEVVMVVLGEVIPRLEIRLDSSNLIGLYDCTVRMYRVTVSTDYS